MAHPYQGPRQARKNDSKGGSASFCNDCLPGGSVRRWFSVQKLSFAFAFGNFALYEVVNTRARAHTQTHTHRHTHTHTHYFNEGIETGSLGFAKANQPARLETET